MIVRAPNQQVLWLIRHAETNWDRMGWVQGHLDSPRLTRRGRQQARRVASLLVTKDVGVVYSSDLRRARTTADIIAERLGRPVVADSRLRERNFGKLEGSPTGAPTAETTGICGGRVTDVDARPPGGESIDDLALRCRDFIDWLVELPRHGDVVVVAHGGSIRLLQAALAGTQPAGMTWGPVGIASVHRVVLDALTAAVRVHPGHEGPHWARAPSRQWSMLAPN
jgi:broad specificity phosphatase PhoE